MRKKINTKMTSLEQEQHNQQMADMASFDEEMPSVGIFWYDEQSHSLFGEYIISLC